MAFWRAMRERLTIELIEVRYEALITDFRVTMIPLFDRLGLEWSELCTNLFSHQRHELIRTPSFALSHSTTRRLAGGAAINRLSRRCVRICVYR